MPWSAKVVVVVVACVVVVVVVVVVLLVGLGGVLQEESATRVSIPETMKHLSPMCPEVVEQLFAGVPSTHVSVGCTVLLSGLPPLPKQLHFCSNGTIFVPMIR